MRSTGATQRNIQVKSKLSEELSTQQTRPSIGNSQSCYSIFNRACQMQLGTRLWVSVTTSTTNWYARLLIVSLKTEQKYTSTRIFPMSRAMVQCKDAKKNSGLISSLTSSKCQSTCPCVKKR